MLKQRDQAFLDRTVEEFSLFKEGPRVLKSKYIKELLTEEEFTLFEIAYSVGQIISEIEAGYMLQPLPICASYVINKNQKCPFTPNKYERTTCEACKCTWKGGRGRLRTLKNAMQVYAQKYNEYKKEARCGTCFSFLEEDASLPTFLALKNLRKLKRLPPPTISAKTPHF